jgi:aspartyl-tRNA(Asn)/glutamyl-tRNA(Gln) amidotransferase subunit B
VIHSATDAGDFARELRLLLRTLGVAEANMEKGEMRVEANISVGQDGKLGTKVEVKNLNSFRSMERAIAHEIDRQTKILESGETVTQETRGWDESRQVTYPQRIKEGSADYRYFPDPDLPSLKLSEIPEFDHAALRGSMPQLPWERREAYQAWGLQKDDIELYVRDRTLGAFFDDVAQRLADDTEAPRTASNYIATDLVKRIRDMQVRDTEESDISDIPVSAEHFAALIKMIRKNEISSRAAKDLLGMMIEHDEGPEALAEKHGLKQSSNEADLLPIIEGILSEHTSVVADYKAGKEVALQFLVGQGMKATRGSADPQALRALMIATMQKS